MVVFFNGIALSQFSFVFMRKFEHKFYKKYVHIICDQNFNFIPFQRIKNVQKRNNSTLKINCVPRLSSCSFPHPAPFQGWKFALSDFYSPKDNSTESFNKKLSSVFLRFNFFGCLTNWSLNRPKEMRKLFKKYKQKCN